MYRFTYLFSEIIIILIKNFNRLRRYIKKIHFIDFEYKNIINTVVYKTNVKRGSLPAIGILKNKVVFNVKFTLKV